MQTNRWEQKKKNTSCPTLPLEPTHNIVSGTWNCEIPSTQFTLLKHSMSTKVISNYTLSLFIENRPNMKTVQIYQAPFLTPFQDLETKITRLSQNKLEKIGPHKQAGNFSAFFSLSWRSWDWAAWQPETALQHVGKDAGMPRPDRGTEVDVLAPCHLGSRRYTAWPLHLDSLPWPDCARQPRVKWKAQCGKLCWLCAAARLLINQSRQDESGVRQTMHGFLSDMTAHVPLCQSLLGLSNNCHCWLSGFQIFLEEQIFFSFFFFKPSRVKGVYDLWFTPGCLICVFLLKKQWQHRKLKLKVVLCG